MAKKQLGPTTNLFPMPTLLVAVKTGQDRANILTIAWAGIVAGKPPVLAIEIAPGHYSTPFIEREGNFSVNIPRSTQAVQADYCGLVSGRQDPDKPGTCGWTMIPAMRISSPLIAECPLNLECRLVRKIELEQSIFFLAEIVETHVEEEALGVDQVIDPRALDPLIFTPNGEYYRLGERIGRAWDIGKALKKGAP